MSVSIARYSLRKNIFQLLLAVSFLLINNAHSSLLGGQSCNELSGKAQGKCQAFPECAKVVQSIGSACARAEMGGLLTLGQLQGMLGDVQEGSMAPAASKGEGASGTNAFTGTTGASGLGACSPATVTPAQASALPGCQTAVRDLVAHTRSFAGGAGGAAGNIGSATNAASSLKDSIIPGLIGAGIGALAGYMLGQGDDESSSSAAEETPPSLPPAPESPPEPSSSSQSSVASNDSSSSSGIETPAVVRMPTVDPNDESGDDNSEILVAANEIVSDDGDGDGSTTGEDTSGGGTTTLGGTTGGGTTGDGEVADNGDGGGRSVDDVSVEDDNVIGLVGGASRTAAGLVSFDAPSGSESSTQGGGGSNMVLGTPGGKPKSRGLAGSSASSAKKTTSSSSSSSSSSSVKPLRTSSITNEERGLASQSSSASSTRTREQIREDLRRRGLIQ